MTDKPFGRGFDHEAMAELGHGAPEWWFDLLRQWRVPGAPSDAGMPLRLAVRNGTLNFYRRGQSVAQVGFGRGRRPYARVHEKYCREAKEGSGYLRCEAAWREPGSGFLATVEEWTSRADGYADAEKSFVETLVAVEPRVIDLEIGLPGYKPKDGSAKRRSLRIDLALLKRIELGWELAFWEVKLKGDPRLVASGNMAPEVVAQMAEYAPFLQRNTETLRAAYVETCKVQVALAEQARAAGNPIILSDAIEAVAGGAALAVKQDVGLLVQDPSGGRDDIAWRKHRLKLVDHFGDQLRRMTEAERLTHG